MFLNRKKWILKNLETSFGKEKTEGFNFDLIKRYDFNLKQSSDTQILSDQTIDDLDFDLFFRFVDRTTSKVGQQYLYSKARTLDHHSSGKFDHQEKVIQHFMKHPEDRLKIQYQLQKLNNQQAYYIVDLFQEELDEKPRWYALIPILSLGSLFSLLLSAVNPGFVFLFLSFFAINILIHYGLKRKTNMFINSIPALLSLGAVAKNMSKYDFLKRSEENIDLSLRAITTIRRKMSMFKLEQKVDSDMEAAYWYVLELIKITFLLEPLLLFSSLDNLRFKSKEIEQVYRFVGEVDSIISVSSLRFGLDEYCVPTISNDISKVRFKDMRHPLIPNCVPNNVDFEKSVLLTGSNMSGKTTYIRAIGLNTISGMTLNTCFAKSAIIPVANLFSVIRIEDDLMNSSSYFFKEADEMKNIIQQTGQITCSIVLLDELFKGTNTIERIASAKAILSFLSKRNCHIFVSTHDIELTELLKDEFELAYFSEQVSDETIHFDYKLKSGVPEKGNAIRILEMNGYPKEITHDANSYLIEMRIAANIC
jgi:hypothetical protein